MRQPEDFVADLLAKKTSWQGIVAIARLIRGGAWRLRVQEILQEKGLMPTDPEEIGRQKDEALKAALLVEQERKKARDTRRKRRSPSRFLKEKQPKPAPAASEQPPSRPRKSSSTSTIS